MHKPLSLLLVIFLFVSVEGVFSAEPSSANDNFIAVTSYNKNTIKSLSRKTLRGYFTLKRGIWPDGTAVQLVTLNIKNKQHIKFIESKLKLFSYQVNRIWQRQIFSGSARKPIEVDNYKLLLKTVAATPGSIGYITQSQLKALEHENITTIIIE